MGFQGVVVARRVVSLPAINQISYARDRRGVFGHLAVQGHVVVVLVRLMRLVRY